MHACRYSLQSTLRLHPSHLVSLTRHTAALMINCSMQRTKMHLLGLIPFKSHASQRTECRAGTTLHLQYCLHLLWSDLLLQHHASPRETQNLHSNSTMCCIPFCLHMPQPCHAGLRHSDIRLPQCNNHRPRLAVQSDFLQRTFSLSSSSSCKGTLFTQTSLEKMKEVKLHGLVRCTIHCFSLALLLRSHEDRFACKMLGIGQALKSFLKS